MYGNEANELSTTFHLDSSSTSQPERDGSPNCIMERGTECHSKIGTHIIKYMKYFMHEILS